MVTTVTTKNMVTIPAAVGRQFGIRPGFRLDWDPIAGTDEIRVRVLPDRAELARRLAGAGRTYAPERDAVAELIAEREQEA
jgi:bifunctional DNA-binding transcriptional regulator/antitoxin component of YhaV-PrlF toxin-antitoxin module